MGFIIEVGEELVSCQNLFLILLNNSIKYVQNNRAFKITLNLFDLVKLQIEKFKCNVKFIFTLNYYTDNMAMSGVNCHNIHINVPCSKAAIKEIYL